MEQHTHGPDGLVIIADQPAAAEAVGAIADADAVEEVAEASVEVARIEADRDVELAKLAVKAEQADTSELDHLRGEVAALRAIVDAMKPPEPEPAPDPAPVVVEAPPVEEPSEPAPPIVEGKPPARSKSSGLSWF